MATRVILTYADYAALPADGRRYGLAGGGYQLTARLESAQPTALPSFPDLTLDPAALWP